MIPYYIFFNFMRLSLSKQNHILVRHRNIHVVNHIVDALRLKIVAGIHIIIPNSGSTSKSVAAVAHATATPNININRRLIFSRPIHRNHKFFNQRLSFRIRGGKLFHGIVIRIAHLRRIITRFFYTLFQKRDITSICIRIHFFFHCNRRIFVHIIRNTTAHCIA